MRWWRRATTSFLWVFAVTTTSAETVPAAIGIEPSQTWEGNDGPWSSFPIRVGTPAQNLRVFISTAATSTWVVGTLGCQGTGVPANCSDIRGELFNSNSSSSWTLNGDFGLFIEDSLGYAGDEGEFGFDTVGLGFVGSGGPTLNHTVTAWTATPDFFIGELGLNPRPTNFSTFNDPQKSYLSLLYEQKIIPSLAYSYTAGAKYRFNGVLGSLTLGGYDDSLFIPNNVSFDFFFDETHDLTVGLQSITATNGSLTSLLPKGILTFIDSTIPQIWLPIEACEAFEAAFGLTYDNTTNFYLLNSTQHDHLLSLNPNITFTLAPTLSSPVSQTLNITFPYSAFDLQLTYPLTSTPTWYFPLRRAANESQYVLGRTFLQEAYLTINYHEHNFSLSQRAWSQSTPSHLISIFGPSSSTPPHRFPTGAIAGITVGSIILILLILLASYLYLRRRQAEKESAAIAAAIESDPKHGISSADPFASPPGPGELDSPVKAPTELHGKHFFSGSEVDGTPSSERRFELLSPVFPGIDGLVELEAPHGKGELSGARPVEIDPPPPLTPLEDLRSLSEGRGSRKNGGRSEDGVDSETEGEVKPTRPFSWESPPCE